jgi:hypothetical protein
VWASLCQEHVELGIITSAQRCPVQLGTQRTQFCSSSLSGETTFKTLWSTGRAWGVYTQHKDRETGAWQPSIEVLGGDATSLSVHACGQTLKL